MKSIIYQLKFKLLTCILIFIQLTEHFILSLPICGKQMCLFSCAPPTALSVQSDFKLGSTVSSSLIQIIWSKIFVSISLSLAWSSSWAPCSWQRWTTNNSVTHLIWSCCTRLWKFGARSTNLKFPPLTKKKKLFEPSSKTVLKLPCYNLFSKFNNFVSSIRFGILHHQRWRDQHWWWGERERGRESSQYGPK